LNNRFPTENINASDKIFVLYSKGGYVCIGVNSEKVAIGKKNIFDLRNK